jgi:hypothetical protein
LAAMAVCRVEEHLTDSKTTGNKKDVRSNKKVTCPQLRPDCEWRGGGRVALLVPDATLRRLPSW